MRSTRQTRTMVSFMAMTLIFASGVIALQLKPTWTETIDPLQTPYFGKFGGNAFLIRGKLNHTDGQRLTHRLALAIVGTLVLGFLLRPKIDLRCLVYQGCSLTMQWVFRNRWVGALLAVGLLVLEMPSFQKTPDFSLCNDKTMTAVHQHMTGVVGHGDRLAGGDVLFRDVTPLYGVLLPTILAVWERNLGLLAFGDVLRLMVALEMIYLVTAMYLFLTWSRMRWVWAAAALSLMLPYYYSESNCLIPQNHGIWRMCGIPLTVLSLWCLRSLGAVRSSWIAGMVCAIAILANIESGISSSAGVGVYLTLRFGTRDGRIVWTQVASFAWRVALAMLSTFGAFWAAYAILLGDFPDIRGVGEIWVYAQLGGSGFGSSPLKWVDLPRTGWPLLMFVHAAGTLTYTVWTGSYGHRGAFRASVAGIFLVWFSYFMNRPDPIYSCSFMFLYGFLLIDSLRLVTAAV